MYLRFSKGKHSLFPPLFLCPWLLYLGLFSRAAVWDFATLLSLLCFLLHCSIISGIGFYSEKLVDCQLPIL